MTRLIGLLLFIDGVLQLLVILGLTPSVLDRSLRDQLFAAAHVLAGLALAVAGQGLAMGSPERDAPAAMRTAVIARWALISACVIALAETTWFNWTETAIRAAYTAIVLYMLTRKTTLPTT
jgi:hypothetical protein